MPRSCLILGAGRSGTSMLAGCLAESGYWMGDDLLEPGEANPRGFFESGVVNEINETLLKTPVDRRMLRKMPWWRHPFLAERQRWLACLPAPSRTPAPVALTRQIQDLAAHAPYCFKDPRFSFTLLQWLPHLDNVVLVGVFREPTRTIQSIVTECASAPYLDNVQMTSAWAERIWCCNYAALLQLRRKIDTPFIMLHFDQLLDGTGFDRLELALDAKVDRDFPTATLRRSTASGDISRRTQTLYQKLCHWAQFPS